MISHLVHARATCKKSLALLNKKCSRLKIDHLSDRLRFKKVVGESVKFVPRFALELRPSVLDDLGMVPALQSFIKDTIKRTHLQISFSAFSGLQKLSPEKTITVFRDVQSAVKNVASHAKRLEMFPGTFKIELPPGRGTTMQAKTPVAEMSL